MFCCSLCTDGGRGTLRENKTRNIVGLLNPPYETWADTHLLFPFAPMINIKNTTLILSTI